MSIVQLCRGEVIEKDVSLPSAIRHDKTKWITRSSRVMTKTLIMLNLSSFPFFIELELNVHTNRQDNCCDAFPLQAPLNGKGRLIVQNSLKRIFLTENQLSCKH